MSLKYFVVTLLRWIVTKAKRAQLLKQVSFTVAVIAALLVLTFAKIDNRVSPFAFAFLFATPYLLRNRHDVFIYATFAFLFSLFVNFGQSHIISSLASVVIYLALAFSLPKIRQKQKPKLEYSLVFFFYIVANLVGVVFARDNLTDLYISLTSLCIGMVFLGACLVFINAARTRKNRVPWTLDQKICAGVFLVILSLGLMGFDNDYFSLHRFVTISAILITATMFDARASFITATCLGLGAALLQLDLIYVGVYVVIALSAVSFRTRTKYLSIIAVMVTDVVLGFYFQAYFGYGFYDVLPLVLACLFVLVIPRTLEKYFDFSKSILSGYLVSKNTINKNRAGVYKRLDNLSNVFNEMQNIYKNLVTGSATQEESSKLIARHIVDNVCSSCPNRPKCRRDATSSHDIDRAFEKLCFIGLQRGSVNFLDMPPDMSVKCTKLNAVLNMANAYVSQLQTQEQSRLKTDAGKILMAGLLSGLHKLCKNFAGELGGEVVFDVDKAAEIKHALLCAGIVASDCLITRNKQGEYNVSVLVTRGDAQNTAIERVISTVAGHRLCIESIDDAETAGFSIVSVKTAPRYQLLFGIAQVAKDFNPQNGDTFSFLKITSDKTLMALCDGMGSGERAHRASVLAISLVENFYKAGFPNEVIMESVNQLLILTNQEAFSAIDIAVFSLNDGAVNFIKVGGVEGFIKRNREIEVIEAGSLPLGVVEEMVPKITRAHLGAGDMVVICSDGVTDSFGDRVALGNFINNLQTNAPQKIADEIIAECIRRTDKIAIDDCTVAVARLDVATVNSQLAKLSSGKDKATKATAAN